MTETHGLADSTAGLQAGNAFPFGRDSPPLTLPGLSCAHLPQPAQISGTKAQHQELPERMELTVLNLGFYLVSGSRATLNRDCMSPCSCLIRRNAEISSMEISQQRKS